MGLTCRRYEGMDLGALAQPDAVGRFLVTAFFASVFLQSSLDKVFDRRGNLEYLRSQFKAVALVPSGAIPLLLSGLTALEAAAGVVSLAGVVSGDFARRGFGLAAAGVGLAGLALLTLILGQRIAKDYGGAAVIAAYFAVALLGISLF